jgi:hypothetical protein
MKGVMRGLFVLAVLLIGIACVHAADAPLNRDLPPGLQIPDAARPGPTFDVDKATREMREGFRITLANSGDVARTVTVREHPNRWRAWTLASSSHKPERQSPDLLEFRIAVPAGGEATLDHVVRYTWTPADE